MLAYGIVVHGGVGSPASWGDGCRRAVARGRSVLEGGGSALDAVVEAARDLEDDGRFNAGSGSQFRLDGATIEMDAAVMASDGRLGGVAAIQRVKNPVQVAREVIKTPHVLLAGEGAVGFARCCGFADFYQPSTQARERFEKISGILKGGRAKELREPWRSFDIRRYWNFPARYDELFCDTVGAVAIDRSGLLAVANSTGGATPMLRGRVGDSPIVGCGFYAGPSAAVAATGLGEEIIRRMLCRQVYDWISQGEGIESACRRGVALFPADTPVGLIAISRGGFASAANLEMAWAVEQA